MTESDRLIFPIASRHGGEGVRSGAYLEYWGFNLSEIAAVTFEGDFCGGWLLYGTEFRGVSFFEEFLTEIISFALFIFILYWRALTTLKIIHHHIILFVEILRAQR